MLKRGRFVLIIEYCLGFDITFSITQKHRFLFVFHSDSGQHGIMIFLPR